MVGTFVSTIILFLYPSWVAVSLVRVFITDLIKIAACDLPNAKQHLPDSRFLIIQFLYDCAAAVKIHATLDLRMVKQLQNQPIYIT